MPDYRHLAKMIFSDDQGEGPAFIESSVNFRAFTPTENDEYVAPVGFIVFTAHETLSFNIRNLQRILDFQPGSFGDNERLEVWLPNQWVYGIRTYSGPDTWKPHFQSEEKFRFLSPGALADGGDLAVLVTAEITEYIGAHGSLQSEGNIIGGDYGVKPVTVPADVTGETKRLSGLQWDIQIDVDGTYTSILPKAPLRRELDIWCEPTAILGDFSTLAITPSDPLLESVSSKSVSLRTSYRPELEDLDTLIVFGADNAGVPVVWQIENTERTDREIIVHLSADVT